MAGWQRPVCRGLLSYPLVRASPSCSGSRTVGWSSWALANKPSPELTDLSPIPSPSPSPGRLSRRGSRLDLRPQLDHGLPVRVVHPAPLVGSRHRVQGRERNPNPNPIPSPNPSPNPRPDANLSPSPRPSANSYNNANQATMRASSAQPSRTTRWPRPEGTTSPPLPTVGAPA